MTIAILSGILGGILGDFSKLTLFALLMSLLAVFAYFFISKGILFKAFLFTSVVLIIADIIISQKNTRHKNRRKDYI